MKLRYTGACVVLALSLAGCASARTPAAQPGGGQQSGEGADALRQRQKVSRVLRDFREDLEGATARRVMEAIDESMTDVTRFEDQIAALMRGTLERRVFLRESSWDVKGDRASVTVDAEMILTTRTRARTQQRRRERLQFDFVRTAKGWKIAEISPRGFFAL